MDQACSMNRDWCGWWLCSQETKLTLIAISSSSSLIFSVVSVQRALFAASNFSVELAHRYGMDAPHVNYATASIESSFIEKKNVMPCIYAAHIVQCFFFSCTFVISFSLLLLFGFSIFQSSEPFFKCRAATLVPFALLFQLQP